MNIVEFITELYCKIDDALPEAGRLQSQHGFPKRRATVWRGRKAQVLARSGRDIRSGTSLPGAGRSG